MPNRQIINGEPYRYAYQGQEKDPETGKEAFQLRLWDARIGRWLTTDPKREFSSPYLGMGNNPMNKIDPDGGSTEGPQDKWKLGKDGKLVKIEDTNTADIIYNHDMTESITLAKDGIIADAIKNGQSGKFEGVDYLFMKFDSPVYGLFEFMANNTSNEVSQVITPNVEYIGYTDVKDNHKYDVSGSAALIHVYKNGGKALEFNHSHPFEIERSRAHLMVSLGLGKFKDNIPPGAPSGFRPGNTSGDKFAAKNLLKKYPGIKLHVYNASSMLYYEYDNHSFKHVHK